MPNADRAFRPSETRPCRFDPVDVCDGVWFHSVLSHAAQALVVACDSLVDAVCVALEVADDGDPGDGVVMRIQ